MAVTKFYMLWLSRSLGLGCSDEGEHTYRSQPRAHRRVSRVCVIKDLAASYAEHVWHTSERLGANGFHTARNLEKKYKAKGWTKTHGYFVQMGGFALYDRSKQSEASLVLDPDKIDQLVNQKLIEFPSPAEEEIKDRSKSDCLAKALVVCQTTWFIIQCVARKVEGLDVTELELVTVALAFLNGTMYFLWWAKPLDVGCPIQVYLLGDATLDSFEALHHDHSEGRIIIRMRQYFKVNFGISSLPLDTVFERLGQMISESRAEQTFYAWTNSKQENAANIFAVFIGTIFGAIHCAAWTYTFPSLTESIIWRISCAVTTALPLFMIFVACLERARLYGSDTNTNDSDKATTQDTGDTDSAPEFLLGLPIYILMLVLIPAYIISRLALVCEAFIALRDLPPSAYRAVGWVTSFPHV